MKKVLLFSMLLVGLLSLTACTTATGSNYKPVQDVPESKALIYIYKARTYGASMWAVFVDKKVVTVLRRGGYYPYLADTGKVEIGADMLPRSANLVFAHLEPKRAIHLDVEAGETYYVKMASGAKPKFVIMIADEAKAELAKCVLLPSRQDPNEDAVIPGLIYN